MYPANWWPRVYVYWPANWWPDAPQPATVGEGMVTAAVAARTPGATAATRQATATTTARQPGAAVEVHP